MADKKQRGRSERAEPMEGEFVRAVAEIFSFAEVRPNEAALGPDDRLEARTVATGLLGIKLALDQEYLRLNKEKRSANRRADAIAHNLARELFEALILGMSHPIWRYVSNIVSVNFGPGRPPASRREHLRRNFIVHLVFALQEAARRDGKRMTRKEAADMLAQAYDDESFSVTAIKDWTKNGSVSEAKERALELVQHVETIDDDHTLVERIILQNWQNFQLLGRGYASILKKG
jgi:hypothetical protein